MRIDCLSCGEKNIIIRQAGGRWHHYECPAPFIDGTIPAEHIICIPDDRCNEYDGIITGYRGGSGGL